MDARVTGQGMRLPTPATLSRLPPVRPVRTPATLPRLLPVRVVTWKIGALVAALAVTIGELDQPLWITICALTGLAFLTTSIRIAGRHLAGWALIWLGRRLRQHANRQDSTVPTEPGSPAV